MKFVDQIHARPSSPTAAIQLVIRRPPNRPNGFVGTQQHNLLPSRPG